MALHFDIVVVGAGHAGCEAAAAAARLGRKTALVTMSRAHIGRLSCNPAIGGLGKGHLVRELDALGGLMGRIADATCIQFRRLNTRKGLAVQSSRAQVDIDLYPRRLAEALFALDGLTVLEGVVASLRTRGGKVEGITLRDGTRIDAGAVVLTTGTFLAAVMHRGDDRTPGGRIGDDAATELSRSLQEAGLRLGRLKTGTVPRLDGRTIHWDRLRVQEDTLPGGRFSFARPGPRLPEVRCYLTYTHEQAHELIRGSLDRSPLYTGKIVGRGPRYCPSIEDKVVRFPDRERHLLFLEPEGLSTPRVYVNGLSTSLPMDVQDRLIHAIEGLEDATILQHGYAVEYDYSDPTDLRPDLAHRAVEGLWLAGQVNGTSGYEEAAVQGFVAGVSAARGEPFVLGRDEAYIGVLTDDLTSKGIGGEPYRMFTSRAEHRLLLREDNADVRLMPRGRALGLVDDETWGDFEMRERHAAGAREALATVVRPGAAMLKALEALEIAAPRHPTTAEALLRRPEVSYGGLRKALAPELDLPPLPDDVAQQVEVDVKYAGYIALAERRAEAARKLERMCLPADLDWLGFEALSWEVRERAARARPATLGQLARLPGITPAAVNVVAARLARENQERQAPSPT